MSRPSASEVAVVLEVGARRSFASALDWPGWSRSGRKDEDALAALVDAGPRYVAALSESGVAPPRVDAAFVVLERLEGSATTDFGAPGAAAVAEDAPLEETEAIRRAALVVACWAALDTAARRAPAVLPKGPRGGGRDRDEIVAHVLVAERAYAAKIGLRVPVLDGSDHDATTAQREALLGVLRAGGVPDRARWSLRYAARRIAWHALDHAWEIEDKIAPAP